MGPGEHRPFDEQYWTPPWSTTLFAGDLFEAIPFGHQPIALHVAERGPQAGKHFLGEIAFGYGMLTTPTCDMIEQHDQTTAHPFRVLVPVIPLSVVADATAAVGQSVRMARARDTIRPYMYLPSLPGVLEEEGVACLFRPSLVSDDLLADPPRRVAQLQPEARRHLKVKLAAYWARVAIDVTALPLAERGEEQLRAMAWPPSRYDDQSGARMKLGVD